MIVLFFSLGDNRYAIKCERVREITPMVTLKPVPHAPDYFAGLFYYRGNVIPVVDLCRLVIGQPCRMRLSTRIIVAEIPMEDGSICTLGLMAERVTGASRRSEEMFVKAGVQVQSVPFLQGVLMEGKLMVHLLDVDLIPGSLSIFG